MDTHRLRQHAVQSGAESRVQVNQRMLIDKMLARYSSDFVVCRELIQNADDAKATSFQLEITCQPSHLIEEIRATNNGLVFNETDWKRIAAIAEGNTNVESVGQFGVGFFSVFSFSEEPIIISGKEYMAFVWRDDQSLTTYRHQLPVEEQQLDQTSIILKMRSNYLLKNDSSKQKRKSKTNEEMIPIIELHQLKIYFTKVLSFTKHINDLMIRINGKTVFHVTKHRRPLPHPKSHLQKNSIHNLLRLNSFLQTEQIFSIEHGPSISLHHVSVDATVTLPHQLDQQIQRILKKNLPSTIQIQLLYPPKNLIGPSSKFVSVDEEILQSLIPMKFQGNQSIPSGLIFIGLGTHQTTGIGMHVYSHLIPTIERENLDLQDPYISKWNTEILLSVGQIARFLYDQLSVQSKEEDYTSIFSCFSFQPSVPNGNIGSILLDGFFSSNKDLLVPVKRSPIDTKISYLPSNQAYLASSKFIHTFLNVPLVPFDLISNGLFQALKERNLITEVTPELIESNIEMSVLLADQFVAFLHWLSSSSNQHDKTYIKRLLSIVRFQETDQSPIITLERLKSYDNFHIPSILPLPPHVLPSSIAMHLSREQLQKQLSLSPFTLKEFVHFYLLKSQQHLFTQADTSAALLTILSKHSGQLNKTEWNKCQSTLANLSCIPTSEGMKIPHDSYIPSSILSSDVPLITLEIAEDDNDDDTSSGISADFLKRLGCRTVNVQSFVQSRASSNSNENSETMKTLIGHLMEEREQMSEGDFNALKKSECLRGTTLSGSKESQKKYAPTDLHFPSVAIQLQWMDLPILDWKDIDARSREYAFLKEIGVREVPELNRLIDRIIQEHHERKSKDSPLPKALIFFAEHFQESYAKLWKTAKIKRAFLPSYLPNKTIVLSSTDQVFQESSPLCPTLLPEVVHLFEEHCNLSSIGIKDRPTLTIAFDFLMEKKDELLNVQSARDIFAYLNQLDGLSRPLIERISKYAFIPLEGSDELMKPSQVFIRPDGSSSRLRQIQVLLDSSSDENDEGTTRRRKRTAKKTGSKNKKTKTVTPLPLDETDKTGLIDYVDFGPEGNSFLLGIGVLHHPSASVLAELLIDRQTNYFSNVQPDDLKRKLLAYTSCLKQLAMAAQTTDELQSAQINKRLKNEDWCLGYQTVERRSNGEKQRIFRIVPANQIYLDDDHQCAIDLRPLLPPDEPELTKLYEKFGAKWLSECVKRNLVHKGKTATSDRGNKLKELIQHRLDMLFVNNRGEKMENLDERNVEMLRHHLSVFEVDGIQCQLTFEKKTIVLESTDSSSCALEHDKNRVYLYIQKYIRDLDYIDIASELARFVFKKPLDTVVHAISDKLASPLETLKRRGVPVDRLLQQSHQHVVLPMTKPSNTTTRTTTADHHYELNHVDMVGYVEDFSRHHMKDEKKYFSSLTKGRAYTQTKFIQQEHVKDEIDHSCEAVPSADMTRHKEMFHSIPLYVERNVRVTETMLDHAKQLAWILTGLAREVFDIPRETLHLYRDIHGARIAFNDRRALFYNLRYYEQVFADQVRPYLREKTPSLPIHHTIVNFYFLLTCHELAHNLESGHNSSFVNHLETIAVKYMTAKDLFLQKFTMENYSQ